MAASKFGYISLVIVFAALTVSCAVKASSPVASHSIDNAVWSMAWVSDEALAVEYRSAAEHISFNSIGVVSPHSGEFISLSEAVFESPDDRDCKRVRQIDIAVGAQPGTVMFSERCSWEDQSGLAWRYSLKSLHVDTREVELVQHLPLRRWANQVSWSPDRDVIVQSFGPTPLNGTVMLYSPNYGTEGYYPTWFKADKTLLEEHDVVGWPDWGEPGIALLATGVDDDAQSVFDISGQRWTLYIVDPETETKQRLVSGIKDPELVRWSPDFSRIAFSAKRDRTQGVWVYDVAEGTTKLVWRGRGTFAWSPDGTHLAVTELNSGLEIIPSTIDILDLDPVPRKEGLSAWTQSK